MDPNKAQLLEEQFLSSLPERFDLTHVTVDYLVPLFSLYLSAPTLFSRLSSALTDRLLDLTLRQAVEHSPFYAELYKGLVSNGRMGFDQLASLPIIDRSDVEQAGKQICSRNLSYAITSYTSGTTSTPLMIDRSKEEQQYLALFFSRLQSQTTIEQEDPMILVLAGWRHGQQIKVPSRAYGFPVALASEEGFLQAVRLLGCSFHIGGKERRISAISGGLPTLLMLTVYFAAEGLDDLAEQISQVHSAGHYITDYTRTWLSNFWQCPISDKYSMTELITGATLCGLCGFYHFDPFGIPEVVRMGDNQQITKGRGRLLLTGLYPFSQMTPLIRYAPGDLVEVHPVECPNGSSGYTFLGRSSSGLDLTQELGAGAFLTGGEVHEVLDPLTDVNRPTIVAKIPQSVHGVGGMPIFQLSRDERGAAQLAIELRYTPQMFPEQTGRLREVIKSCLVKQSPYLQGLFEQELLCIKFVEPGNLGADPKFRP